MPSTPSTQARVALLRKIEVCWITNVEIPTNPDFDGAKVDENGIVPGPVMTMQLLMDIALGDDERSRFYYDEFRQHKMSAPLHARSRLLVTIALAAVVCATTGASPPGDAFVQAEAVRSRSLSLFNKSLFTASDGDFVHPRLSPDGSKLIYADVLVREGIEGTAIYITDLASKKTRKLLSADDAEKYQAYKVFVSNIRWLDNSRVEVYLADGDVGMTCLTFDATSNAVVSERSIEPGDDEDAQRVPPEFEAIRGSILAVQIRCQPFFGAGDLIGGE